MELLKDDDAYEQSPLLEVVDDTDEQTSLLEAFDDVSLLPAEVQAVVSVVDDPAEPTLTFRYFVLTILFVVPGAFLDTMGSYRTSTATYSVLFVQVASHWAGKWLANVLPSREVGIGKYKLNLNPGPWSIKENVLVTLSAASGATGNLGTSSISLAEVFYNDKVHPAIAILYMWAIVWTGYSFAAIARNFLLYDPQFRWPQALMQTALFEAFRKQDQVKDSMGSRNSNQIKVFFIAAIGLTIWQFFPEFIFPMTSSLAILCWMAPDNSVMNFIGSGLGGMGVLNFTLDWSNITSSIMLMPYWTQVVKFVAFAFSCWILIPLAKWGNLTSYSHGLMSNKLFLENGTLYPTDLLISADYRFNETAYQELGPVYVGSQMLWNMFFDYASYVSAFAWLLCFGRKELTESIKRLYKRYTNKNYNANEFGDRLNKIQQSYDDVPLSWFVILFLLSFIILSGIFLSGYMFIPWWTYVVALIFGATIVTPMGWLYALSNFQLAIGSVNELLYGYMINLTKKGFKHPAGATSYGAVAGDAWYRAQYMLQDQKIGHYMHIPPKAVFFSQIFGELIGIPVNYLCLRWILNTKGDYLSGKLVDPLHQWTGQTLNSYHTQAIEYVLIGPQRLFALDLYHPLPYAFIFGIICPIVVYMLYKSNPSSRLSFNYWNTTIFFSSMSKFYGNISTGPLSQFIGGSVTNFYIYRYWPRLWANYNYLIGAAFDTGFNVSMLVIFMLFNSGAKLQMPYWWGNNEQSVERCFALK